MPVCPDVLKWPIASQRNHPKYTRRLGRCQRSILYSPWAALLKIGLGSLCIKLTSMATMANQLVCTHLHRSYTFSSVERHACHSATRQQVFHSSHCRLREHGTRYAGLSHRRAVICYTRALSTWGHSEALYITREYFWKRVDGKQEKEKT